MDLYTSINKLLDEHTGEQAKALFATHRSALTAAEYTGEKRFNSLTDEVTFRVLFRHALWLAASSSTLPLTPNDLVRASNKLNGFTDLVTIDHIASYLVWEDAPTLITLTPATLVVTGEEGSLDGFRGFRALGYTNMGGIGSTSGALVTSTPASHFKLLELGVAAPDDDTFVTVFEGPAQSSLANFEELQGWHVLIEGDVFSSEGAWTVAAHPTDSNLSIYTYSTAVNTEDEDDAALIVLLKSEAALDVTLSDEVFW